MKKYNFGFTLGVGTWPSDAFDYMRIQTKPSFQYSYNGISILEQEIKLKVLYRVSFQYNFSSYFGLQGEISHQRASYKVNFTLFPQYPALRAQYAKHRLSWSVSSLILNAVFQARKSKEVMVPYAFIGLGFCDVQGEREENDDYVVEIHSSIDLSLKAGGGFSYYLFQSMPFGIDLRAFIMVLGARMFGFYTPYGGSDIIISGYNIIWGIEAGFRYRF